MSINASGKIDAGTWSYLPQIPAVSRTVSIKRITTFSWRSRFCSKEKQRALSGRQKSSPDGDLFCREALFAYSSAARRAAKSVRKALLRKAAETDVHAVGFGMIIGGLQPSATSQGGDSLAISLPSSITTWSSCSARRATFKTGPALYPDRFLPAREADTPALSDNRVKIPGPGRCPGRGLRF